MKIVLVLKNRNFQSIFDLMKEIYIISYESINN